MADRELSNALASGELTSIQLGSALSTEKVLTQAEVDAKIKVTDDKVVELDLRVDELEASHTQLIIATSVAASQQPVTTDTPLQVEFGPLKTTTNIDLSATGALTFKTAGKYIVSPFFQYGRVGSSGTSFLLNRYLVNGVQVGNSLAAKIDNANTLVPWSSSIQFTAIAGDVLTIEIMRDSTGADAGGLFQALPVAPWNAAPSASIQIYKAT